MSWVKETDAHADVGWKKKRGGGTRRAERPVIGSYNHINIKQAKLHLSIL